MPYDWGVEGVLAAVGRRPVAGVGFVVALAYVALVVVESTTTSPWDHGGLYVELVSIVSLAWEGVVGVAAFVWLLERAAA